MAQSAFQVKKTIAVGRVVRKRRVQRDMRWPDANTVVFQPKRGGWAQIPRTVPMIASLLDTISGKDSPGRVYLTLWSYDFGEGYVEVPDPAMLALEAGYMTSRGERTFVERMRVLRDLGFIRSQPVGIREFGYVLLVDPNRAVVALREAQPDRVPERWWTVFVARCGAAGIPLGGAPASKASDEEEDDD